MKMDFFRKLIFLAKKRKISKISEMFYLLEVLNYPFSLFKDAEDEFSRKIYVRVARLLILAFFDQKKPGIQYYQDLIL